jgi:DNA-directed RNA polymerase subunit RPC12/RpoP
MDIRVEQPCPQCGGLITLSASDRLLTCPYCGVKNFLRSNGPFRFALPTPHDPVEPDQLLYAPYLRFKGNVFFITEKGISYRVVDTTQDGFPMPGLPPTLGVRPQAMKLFRLNRESRGRFLRLAVKARVILDKAARINALSKKDGKELYHRAYIGEEVSFIYLPMVRRDAQLLDAVVDAPLIDLDTVASYPLKGAPFKTRWQVRFQATLCPRCGWSLDGEGDCLVLTCSNCDTAWQLGASGLERITCRLVHGGPETALYLGFWKISAHLPSMKIWSFADFMARTNQPVVLQKKWHERVMHFWVPAFKVRPKIFLQLGRQATITQWRLDADRKFTVQPDLYPVTLPVSEARQAVKVLLAAAAASRKKIFPHLAGAQAENISSSLVFLPFNDRNHDWVQPHTGTVIAKSVLKFGRSL